jgi:hypothetical protein
MVEGILNSEFKEDLNLEIYTKNVSKETFNVSFSRLNKVEIVPLYAYLFHIRRKGRILVSSIVNHDSYIKKREFSNYFGKNLSCVTIGVRGAYLFTSFGHFVFNNQRLLAGVFIDEKSFHNYSFNELQTKDFIFALDNKIFEQERFSLVKKYYTNILKKYPNVSYIKMNDLHEFVFNIDRVVVPKSFNADNLSLETERLLLERQDKVVKDMLNTFHCNTNLNYTT